MKTKLLVFALLAVSLTGCQQSNRTKVLNNLVTELLKATAISQPYAEYSFYNLRDGWIFISSTAKVGDSGNVRVAVDSQCSEDAVLVHEAGKERTLEAMRYLPAGEHKISVWCQGSLSLDSLIVRTMPELIYCQYGYGPKVSEYGPYDREFLEKNILKNVNTMIVGAADQLPESVTESWKRQGKKWIGNCPVLMEDSTTCKNYWTGFLDKNSYLDGVIVDEFTHLPKYRGGKTLFSSEHYAQWSEAVEKIYADEKYRDKTFKAYVGNNWLSKPSKAFIQTLMDCGYQFYWEMYLREPFTEEESRELLESRLKQRALDWRKTQPGAEKHMNLCFGLFSAPPMSLDNNPSVNYKVWMDMQVNMIANDPAFSGINGFMWWTSGYADEEAMRWVGRLFRHYAIEGRTEMLSKDPLMLTHLKNPDFNEDIKGWTIKPAEKGSIEVKDYLDYCSVEGRVEAATATRGHTFLTMRRSSNRPNIFSQQIRNLQTGRLYCLKMFTADYRDLIEAKLNKQKHVVKIEIDDVEVDLDKCFQYIFASRICVNYHRLIFRAKGNTAMLKLSDWASEKEPGGPIGQELIYNCIEIQPYLEN